MMNCNHGDVVLVKFPNSDSKTLVEREIDKVIGKCTEWNNIATALRKVFDL